MSPAPRVVVMSRDGKRELGHIELVNGLAVLSLTHPHPPLEEIGFTLEFLRALLEGFNGPGTAVPASEHPESATWPWVLAFAHRMEAKLEANRHKGNREGWLKASPFELFRRVTGIAPDDAGEAEFLAETAKNCRSCSCCQEVPCGACQAGGVCDAFGCRRDEDRREDPEMGDEDEEAAP